jgi:hypothetical protein
LKQIGYSFQAPSKIEIIRYSSFLPLYSPEGFNPIGSKRVRVCDKPPRY